MPQEQSIPVVDLNDFLHGAPAARAEFVRAMGGALTDVGFFALEHHGVEQQLIAHAYQVAEAFFSLPDDKKRRYEVPALKGQRGFVSFGKEHAKNASAPDLKEFWHVGRELPEGHPMMPVYGPNLWPDLEGFKPVMLALYEQLERCACALLQACALYVGVQENLIADMARDGDTILRIIHYPPVPPDADPQSVRAAAHEDINLITLLCESTAPGLELLQRDGRWRPIHALKGQIIVDAGDMLQHLTNGYFKSTTHRVTNPNNERERRLSMPFFVHPRGSVDLTPLAECVEKTGGTQLFSPLTAGQFLEQRLSEIGLK